MAKSDNSGIAAALVVVAGYFLLKNWSGTTPAALKPGAVTPLETSPVGSLAAMPWSGSEAAPPYVPPELPTASAEGALAAFPWEGLFT
jgi:hypothetical protein